MNSVGPLESQHREVEELFFRIAHATDSETRTRLVGELTQHLVAYAAIEDETPSLRGRPYRPPPRPLFDRGYLDRTHL
jgi:hypothetical protein